MTQKSELFDVNIDLDSIIVFPEQTITTKVNLRTIDGAPLRKNREINKTFKN